MVSLEEKKIFLAHFKTCMCFDLTDSYSKADAEYKWKRGRVKSVERSSEIFLPQMDLVEIQASENMASYSTGKALIE